jgi:hypothetical protein
LRFNQFEGRCMPPTMVTCNRASIVLLNSIHNRNFFIFLILIWHILIK